jgi:hypothetical protein
MSDLPPLDQPQAYVVVGPNDQRGPYTLDLLIGEVVAGRLHDATPVWWPGLAEWTTMSGHPGVAAELARRRGGYAAPAAPAAPAPGQYEQATGYEAYQPQPANPQTYEAGQYETASYPVAAEPVQSAPGQDYSYDAGVQAPVTADQAPAPQAVAPVSADPQPVEAPIEAGEIVAEVPDGSSATGAQVPSGWTVTDTSTPFGATTVDPATEIVEAEVVTPEVVRTSSVTDEHRSLFSGLVGRSKARAEASARVEAIDAAFVDAVVSGAESQGFTTTDRTAGDTNHELRFDGEAGETLSITVGRIKGDDPAALRSQHVPLTVRFQSASYAGGIEAGSGEHGEVVIVSDEWSGQATSTVSLLLPLEDYLGADLDVDTVGVLRDVGATVSIVSDRLR